MICSSQKTRASDKDKHQYLVSYHGQEALQPVNVLSLDITLFVCVQMCSLYGSFS